MKNNVKDNVNHPSHYNHGNLEVIDIIKDQLKGGTSNPVWRRIILQYC